MLYRRIRQNDCRPSSNAWGNGTTKYFNSQSRHRFQPSSSNFGHCSSQSCWWALQVSGHRSRFLPSKLKCNHLMISWLKMNHFDVKRSSRLKTVAENIKLPTPLLSRFDTIFLMLDRPDEERDKILSEHVMSVWNFHCDHQICTKWKKIIPWSNFISLSDALNQKGERHHDPLFAFSHFHCSRCFWACLFQR